MLFRTLTSIVALTILLSPLPAARAQETGAESSQRIQQDLPKEQFPEASLGHDQFGYDWSDASPVSWVDATSGTLAVARPSGSFMSGPFTLPFTFTYYGQAFTNVYLSWNGFLSFNSGTSSPPRLPSSNSPNNVIAPYAANFGEDVGNGVYYLVGGTAPNRYMVIEWHDMQGFAYFPHTGNTAGRYRFEAILFESGDIKFQYQVVAPKTGFYLTDSIDSCGVIGMEDGNGKDYVRYQGSTCYHALANKAILIKRPPAQGRLWLANQTLDGLIVAGTSKTFTFTIQNLGDLGADTYDLSIASGWPAALYTSDGATALVDTNANGVIDSGVIAPKIVQTYTVRISAPANLGAGQWNAATMTLRSVKTPTVAQTIKILTTISAPIALAYASGGPAQMNLLLTNPSNQRFISQSISETTTIDGAIARRPDGGFAQLITTRTCSIVGSCNSFQYTWHTYITLITKAGEIENTILTSDFMALQPAMSIAPNGNILIAGVRNPDTGASTIIQDVWFMVVDKTGTVVHSVESLSGLYSADSNGYAGSPSVAATHDGNFVVTWVRAYDEVDNSSTPCKRNGSCALIDAYYAVVDSSGVTVKAAGRLTADTTNKLDSHSPVALVGQTNNKVAFSLIRTDAQTRTVQLGQMDSVGTVTLSPTIIATMADPLDWIDQPRIVELSVGRLLLAWFQRMDGSPAALHTYSFNAALGDKLGPTIVTNSEGDTAPPCCISFAPDSFGHASLVWSAFSSNSQRSFYALIDQTGKTLAPRTTIFETANALTSSPGYFKGINNYGYAIASASTDASLLIFMPMSLR